jgi:hypothetical protein
MRFMLVLLALFGHGRRILDRTALSATIAAIFFVSLLAACNTRVVRAIIIRRSWSAAIHIRSLLRVVVAGVRLL